jgi:single-strand selective monofunctional uracil DNA glycosylase
MRPDLEALITASRRLVAEVSGLRFASPVTHVYNPLEYAWNAWQEYLDRFATAPKRVVFLGMNPGPWGMAQTGVPFGEVAAVRDWMGITARIGVPAVIHEKRPVQGLECPRSEVSGRRLWGLMMDRFGDAPSFFQDHFVANYCPLVFMGETGKNITPDKLPAAERNPLFAACDRFLVETVSVLKPEVVIGIGVFARDRAAEALSAMARPPRIETVLHPSPASPAANRGWAEAVTKKLTELGVWTT